MIYHVHMLVIFVVVMDTVLEVIMYVMELKDAQMAQMKE